MKDHICIFGKLNNRQTKAFLSLSKNKKTEKTLLAGRHILSGYFDAIPFVVFDNDQNIISRCILAHYPNEDTAYIGCFESFDNSKACKLLFDTITEKASELGIKKLIGPYNCSFWLGCHMKLDHFDDTYTGEPYNPPHYPRLWKENGFEIYEMYHSNIYKEPEGHDLKCLQRFEYFKNKGYNFTHMTKRGFKKQLREIYFLLTKLYSNFPEYRHITEAEFMRLYLPLKKVLNLNKAALVYKDGILAAFLIAFPDYSKTKGLLDKMTVLKDPERLVFMYLGADHAHRGLGSALAEVMRDMQEGKTSVGALIHGQKSHYYGNLITDKYNYALFCKNI